MAGPFASAFSAAFARTSSGGLSAALTDSVASSDGFVFVAGIRGLTDSAATVDTPALSGSGIHPSVSLADSHTSSDSLSGFVNAGGTVGWNAADTAGTVNVTGASNQIATFPGSASIRSATSHLTGKYYFEVTVTGSTIDAEGPIIAVGSKTFNMFGNPGQDSPADSIGFYPGDTSQEIILNNVFSNFGFASAPIVSGDVISVCADVTNDDYYFLSPELAATFGATAYNGSNTANPVTQTSPITQNFSTATYIIGRTDVAGTVLTLNTGQSTFLRTPPVGFVAWDASGGVVASILDSGVSSDLFTPTVAIANVFADSVASGDSYAAVIAATPSLIDSSASSTSTAVTLNSLGSLVDNGVISESLTGVAFALLLQDGVATTDTLLPSITLLGSLTDTDSATDALSVSAVTVTLADSITTSEAYTGLVSGLATQADTISSADAVFISQFGLKYTDSAAATDLLGVNNGLTAALNESAASSDTLNVPNVGLLIAESAVSSDSLAVPATTWALSDSVATSDGFPLSGSGIFFATLADNAVSFASPVFQGVVFSLADTVLSADTAAAAMAATQARPDTSSATDGLAIFAVSQLLADTVTSSDSVSELAGNFTAIAADAASTAGDAIIVASNLLLSNITATSDAFTAFSATATFAVADTAASSDLASSVTEATAAILFDGVATTESLISAFNQPTQFTDTNNSADIIAAVFAATATLSDTAITTDTLSSGTNFSVTVADNVVNTDGFSAPSSTLTIADSNSSLTQLFGLAQFPLAVGNSTNTFDALTAIFGDFTNFSDLALTGDEFDSIVAVNYSFNLLDSALLSDSYPSTAQASGPAVMVQAIPTGGAVRISIPGYFNPPIGVTSMRIQRAILGLTGLSPFTLIYSGSLCAEFIDVGDGLPGPLDPNTAYVWQVIDAGGVTQTPAVIPSSSLLSTVDGITPLLMRLMQGSLNNLRLPDGVQKVRMVAKMPMNGWLAMPFIVICLDLIQQTDVAMGEAVVTPTNDNVWTLFSNAKRVWRISVMSQDAEERDFYRDALLEIFRILKATAFPRIGLNVRHTFQAVSYTSTKEWEGQSPGFYGADLMLEIDGIFPSAVMTHYPVILHVESDPTFTPYDFTVELT